VSYTEINVFGVYVAPFAVMMLAAWLITLPLLHLGGRVGLIRHVWHPTLFNIAIYVIVLSLVLLAAVWS
jgi:hypothetical protein